MRPDLSRVGAWYHNYINLVPEDEITEAFKNESVSFVRFLETIPADKYDYRYADGKWTVREVLGHLADCERVLSYRALRFMRGDTTVLQGFDQDAYVPAGRFEDPKMAEVLDEYEAVRHATVSLVEGSPPDAWATRGMVGKNGITSAALLYVIAGHERHHMSLLRTRYLPLAARG